MINTKHPQRDAKEAARLQATCWMVPVNPHALKRGDVVTLPRTSRAAR